MPNLFLGDSLDVLKTLPENSIDSLVTDPPAGIGFMSGGKKEHWDSDKGGREPWIAWTSEIMREALRVMKPGAHGLVWGLPRTSHWTATAIENAGFEIRDVVTHLFGQGFPKSSNVAKQFEKVGNKEAAITWDGFGTALKPSVEFYILIRKPLSEKTVAANVLKHGCGGLNIDASRISPSEIDDYGRSAANSKGTVNAHDGFDGKAFKIAERSGEYASNLGRFPSHLVLDEEAASLLDEQSGILKTGGDPRKTKQASTGIYGMGQNIPEGPSFAGSYGGASRFYYVAKASKSDKNFGLDGNPVNDKEGMAENIYRLNQEISEDIILRIESVINEQPL